MLEPSLADSRRSLANPYVGLIANDVLSLCYTKLFLSNSRLRSCSFRKNMWAIWPAKSPKN